MSRIYLPQALYHVILHGNANESLFTSVTDSQHFMTLLDEGVERFGHTIYAYCLMRDHVHLLIRMHKEPLSRSMHNLSSRYTRYFNVQHQRQGHLFHGRFKAILCEEDVYLYELIRYIHMNPVRNGIASHPEKYLWSSHRSYIGQKTTPWIPSSEILQHFSIYDHLAVDRFQAYIMQTPDDGQHQHLYERGTRRYILGSTDFIAETLKKANRLPQAQLALASIVTAVCASLNVSEYDIRRASRQHHLSQARGMIGLMVQEEGEDRLADVAHYCQRALSSISRSVARVGREVQQDENIQSHYQRALKKAKSIHEENHA